MSRPNGHLCQRYARFVTGRKSLNGFLRDTEKYPGTFTGELINAVPEIIPERKTTALIGPDLVNTALFLLVIKKYAGKFTGQIHFLQGKPVVDPIGKTQHKINPVDPQERADFSCFLFT